MSTFAVAYENCLLPLAYTADLSLYRVRRGMTTNWARKHNTGSWKSVESLCRRSCATCFPPRAR